MTKTTLFPTSHGPFRADQLHSGDPYELSAGHAIQCLPTGGRGSRANLIGGQLLDSDPDVESAGIDTGFAPYPDMLRAPDVAVGNVSDEPGWVKGVPPLAVEYADRGQDEAALTAKIQDLLGAGTRYIWVVRLTGPRRVEVHEPGQPMRLAHPGGQLLAPGILRNPVDVTALYDREAAHEATLRNLLQRRGYESIEAVYAEGEVLGRKQGELDGLRAALQEVINARSVACEEALKKAIVACQDPEQLRAWLLQAAVVPQSIGLRHNQ